MSKLTVYTMAKMMEKSSAILKEVKQMAEGEKINYIPVHLESIIHEINIIGRAFKKTLERQQEKENSEHTLSEFDAVIQNWMYIPTMNQMWGYVYSDKKNRFPDGSDIVTSDVKSKRNDFKPGDIIQTKYSRYLLGRKANGGN